MKNCEHEWIEYTVAIGLGYWSTGIEQAGYCLKCGEDTHGEYLKQQEELKKIIKQYNK